MKQNFSKLVVSQTLFPFLLTLRRCFNQAPFYSCYGLGPRHPKPRTIVNCCGQNLYRPDAPPTAANTANTSNANKSSLTREHWNNTTIGGRVKCVRPVVPIHQIIRRLRQIVEFPFSALTLLARQQKGHLACKKLGVGWLQFDRSVACFIAPVVTTRHLHQP